MVALLPLEEDRNAGCIVVIEAWCNKADRLISVSGPARQQHGWAALAIRRKGICIDSCATNHGGDSFTK